MIFLMRYYQWRIIWLTCWLYLDFLLIVLLLSTFPEISSHCFLRESLWRWQWLWWLGRTSCNKQSSKSRIFMVGIKWYFWLTRMTECCIGERPISLKISNRWGRVVRVCWDWQFPHIYRYLMRIWRSKSKKWADYTVRGCLQ